MSEAANGRSRRVIGIALLGIAGALLFVIVSAYVRHRIGPRWAAAGAGALVFPVLPLAWHLIADPSTRRRRRLAQDERGILTAGDRFLFRLVAVAVLALGPLLALDGGGVWTAMKRHGAWWLDWTDPPAPRSPVSDPRMLDSIPGDAHALVWSLSVEKLGEAVLALGPDAMMVVLKDEPETLDRLTTDDLGFLAKAGGYSGGLDTVRPAPDLMIVVSERWMDPVAERLAGGGTRPGALIDRLRAPPGVSAAAVWHPAPGGPVPVVDAEGWVLGDAIDVRLRMAGGENAATMRERIPPWIDQIVATVRASCPEDPGPVIEHVTVGGEGVDVRIRATLHVDRVLTYLGCVLSPVRDSP